MSVLHQVKNYFSKIRSSSLLHAGFGLTISGLAVGILGYVYQILMGRLLSPNEYALFSSIMAISMLAISPLGAVNMLLARRVAFFLAKNQLTLLRGLYSCTLKWLALSALVFLILLLFFTESFLNYLKLTSPEPVWGFGILTVICAFALVNGAFFQGMQRFKWIVCTGLLNVLSKIILSALLILLGLGVNGALVGILLSALLVWLLGVIVITQSFHPHCSAGQLPEEPFPARTIVPVLVANICFIIMTQFDMVLVNYYFSSQQAGLYAAASVLGKAILYLPGGLVIALFPMVAENQAKGHASTQILIQVVGVTASLCGTAAMIYWWFGPWLITALYGQEYSGAGELLRWFGISVFPMALLMVAEHFLIAKGRVLFAWVFLAIAPFQLLALHLWHENLLSVIFIFGLSGLFAIIFGYGALLREYRYSELRAQKV